MSVTRRDFIKKSATTVAVGLAVPPWLAKMVWADSVADNALAASGQAAGRSLVVIQLTGGNDGLNTVIPYTDAGYAKARPVIGIASKDVVKISDTIGLHPNMAALKPLYPEHKIRAFLVFTAGPRVVEVDGAMLDGALLDVGGADVL